MLIVGSFIFDNEFHNVQIGTKSTKECVQFYYLWKKVCPDDYKRLRILRRKRNQTSLYNLRSQPEGNSGDTNQSVQGSYISGVQEEEEFEGSDSDPESEQITANGMVHKYFFYPFLYLSIVQK